MTALEISLFINAVLAVGAIALLFALLRLTAQMKTCRHVLGQLREHSAWLRSTSDNVGHLLRLAFIAITRMGARQREIEKNLETTRAVVFCLLDGLHRTDAKRVRAERRLIQVSRSKADNCVRGAGEAKKNAVLMEQLQQTVSYYEDEIERAWRAAHWRQITHELIKALKRGITAGTTPLP